MVLKVSIFLDTPELCGHRGSGRGVVRGHRESTLESYRAAVGAGLHWVEVDARVNADDLLVASHEPVAANSDGRLISTLETEETDRAGLMHIADLLEDLPDHVGIDIEVKTSLEDALRPRQETTAALVADVAARALERRPILVSSFDPAALTIVRERGEDVPLGLLTWGGFPLRKAIPAAVHLGAKVVAPNTASFRLDGATTLPLERERSEFVGVAHDAGLQVLVWCPGPEEGRRLIDAGVDCLVIDDVPETVARYR